MQRLKEEGIRIKNKKLCDIYFTDPSNGPWGTRNINETAAVSFWRASFGFFPPSITIFSQGCSFLAHIHGRFNVLWVEMHTGIQRELETCMYLGEIEEGGKGGGLISVMDVHRSDAGFEWPLRTVFKEQNAWEHG